MSTIAARRWSEKLVAGYLERSDEPSGVFIGTADTEAQALRLAAAAARAADCACGHSVFVHTLGTKAVRTWCTHGDGKGPCPCRRYDKGA